ncbi:hypothetical protein ACFLXQ_01515 [Chloroflexota bacterium]
MTKILPHNTGVHDSAETAFIIPDYPTGRRARCVKRVWVETSHRHGQRVCYQTSQPKHKMEAAGWKEGDPIPEQWWRAPKKSTYSDVVVLYLDENDHQQYEGFSFYGDYDLEKWQKRLEEWREGMNEYALEKMSDIIRIIEARRKRGKPLDNKPQQVTTTIGAGGVEKQEVRWPEWMSR